MRLEQSWGVRRGWGQVGEEAAEEQRGKSTGPEGLTPS